MMRKTYNLVLLLDTLALALGRGAALGVAAGAGGMVTSGLRAVVAIGVASVVGVVDNRGDRDVLSIERLEPLGGDVRVLAHQLALEGGLQRGLLLDLADSGGEHGGLASTETGLQSEVFKSAWCLRHHLGFYPLVTYHAGSHGGETVKALTDGLTTLLLRENVVLLLFSIGEARAVVVVRSGAVAAGRRVA
jgi:hypothetical protein